MCMFRRWEYWECLSEILYLNAFGYHREISGSMWLYHCFAPPPPLPQSPILATLGTTLYTLSVASLFSHSSRQRHVQRWQQAYPDGVHPPPDPRAGEGVPLQPLPDPPAAYRDRTHFVSLRTANQNLVPEPTDEVEERTQTAQHENPPAWLSPRRGRVPSPALLYGTDQSQQQRERGPGGSGRPWTPWTDRGNDKTGGVPVRDPLTGHGTALLKSTPPRDCTSVCVCTTDWGCS